MKEPNKNPCVEHVRIAGMFRGATCGRPGKIEVKGKWYCGVHDPIKREKKIEERNKRWDAEFKAKSAMWDWEEKHKKAQDEVTRTARAVFAGRPPVTNPRLQPDLNRDLASLCAAVEKFDQVEKEKPR